MKKLILAAMAFLHITSFNKVDGKNVFTEEERNALNAEFGDEITNRLAEEINNPENIDEEDPEKKLNQEPDESKSPEAATNQEAVLKIQNDLTIAQEALANAIVKAGTSKEEINRLSKEVNELNEQIRIMGKKSSKDPIPSGKGRQDSWDKANKAFLGGVNSPLFAIGSERPYNIRAYNAINRNSGGELLPYKEASSMDYSQLKNDLGEYYRVRKQDSIQSFLVELPSIENIFPLETGYQDQAVLTNVFLGEFSQAENTGSSFDNVVKGSYTFEPEILRMYGVMFSHKFTDLKELERNWLGYLNREGSNPIKLSFIEFILKETAVKLHNEKQLRYVNGIRKNPTVNVAGKALEAANGIREFLRTKIDNFQIRPFAVGEWSDGTISNYVYEMTGMVPEEIRNTGMCVLYMSPDALSKYHKNRETLYGANPSFEKDVMYVAEYPNVKIVTIPGMGSSKRMFYTLEGNIHTYTDIANEMIAFSVEQQDWTLKVWSNWKESIWANMVGKKFASAELIPTDYSTQMIFCNNVDLPSSYYIEMDADDTSPSVLKHTSLKTVANTQATVITNFDDAADNAIIHVMCGSETHASTIAQSGNFSLISAAWTPSLGDTITFMKRPDGKFIELERTTATSTALVIAADDATPDVAAGTIFITSANAAATAITNFDNATAGIIYTIYGGSNTHSSTIANSGNFSIGAAFTLSDGAWIKLVKSASDNKFYLHSKSA